MRTRQAAHFRPLEARERRHRQSELRALERAKKNASCVSAYLLSSSNHHDHRKEEDEESDCDDDCSSTNTSSEGIATQYACNNETWHYTLLVLHFYTGNSPSSNGSKQEDDDDDDDSETEWEKKFRPLKLPPTLVFPPLPLCFAGTVDTRDKEDVPDEFRSQYPPNSHPILRRRYFVFTNDRRRGEDYSLDSDDIVRNPRKDEPDAAEYDRPQRGEILEDPLRDFVDNKVSNFMKEIFDS